MGWAAEVLQGRFQWKASALPVTEFRSGPRCLVPWWWQWWWWRWQWWWWVGDQGTLWSWVLLKVRILSFEHTEHDMQAPGKQVSTLLEVGKASVS